MPLLDDFHKECGSGWRTERYQARAPQTSWRSSLRSDIAPSPVKWKKERVKTEVDYFAIRRAHVVKEPHMSHHYTKWAALAADEFAAHVLRWRRETKHYSSVTRMVMHPSYLRVIGMGRQILPLLLRELETRKDHWLIALNAITGEDPATPECNFQEAVSAWLEWGHRKGYLG
jgi:hypothetical protein